MPLRDEYPVIDDRRYADIVAEAQTRIPRYTPEWTAWTDFNASDPGMTLVQLFAWLTEMQLYRLGKVPALNYLKFLELLGIELEPAKPARAQVTLPVKDSHAEPYVIVPAGTQLASEDPDGEGPLVFETDRALTALTAKLDTLQSFDGYSFKDVSIENAAGDSAFEAFGPLAPLDSALYFGFDYAGLFPATSFHLTFWVPDDSGGAGAFSCNQNRVVSTELAWEYWNGHEWKRLGLLKDDTKTFTQSGQVFLKTPAEGQMVTSVVGKQSAPRYWLRARVSRAGYEAAPQLLAVRSNTVTVTQAETIENESLGGSTGQADQVLQLANAPVLAGSLVFQVDEGEGFVTWAEVADFFGSERDDRHYVLNRTTGEIRFGGLKQRIPVANPNNPANFRALQYRVGGGKRGNLKAGSINSLRDHVAGIDSGAVANLYPAAGGADEESLDQAKARAPLTLKSRDRAVTVEDFELLAMRAGNIARAKALPLAHPDFPGVEVPGVVTVIVVPDVDDPKPMPNEGTLQTVCAYLSERRLLTTELYVAKPKYLEVAIEAEVIAADDADLAEIKQTLEASIEKYFHPLKGGEDSSLESDGLGWPFGGDIFYSRLYHRLLIDGVQRVASLKIFLDGEEYPACQDVAVPEGMLLFNGEHQLEVRYDV